MSHVSSRVIALRKLMSLAMIASALISGCATLKESDTSRTGVEQLLISSAVDRSLDKIDFAPIRGATVYLETKYLECTDKNYIIVALHQRILKNGCTLVEKPEDSQVTMEVGSGGVGTDRQEVFVGIPAIPLAIPSPISIPKMALFTRTKANGTAKLSVVAYDTKSRQPVINGHPALARSDQKNWSIIGSGAVITGSVPDEIKAATGESDSFVPVPQSVAKQTEKVLR
jgi:hypothetical protein